MNRSQKISTYIFTECEKTKYELPYWNSLCYIIENEPQILRLLPDSLQIGSNKIFNIVQKQKIVNKLLKIAGDIGESN